MSEAYEAKLGRLREWLAAEGYGSLVLSRVDSLFWLFGADTHVGLNADSGIAQAVIDPHRVTVVSTNIEAGRLADEELAGLDVDIVAVPWHEDGAAGKIIDERIDRDSPVAADTPGGSRSVVNLAPLRYSLSPSEVVDYRALGLEVGAAIGQVAQEVQRGESEFAAAGRLSSALLSRGITPVVLLVAADERIRRVRHPIPTDRRIDDYVELICCGRRHGLIVAVTRMVKFSAIDDDLRQRHQAVCNVDAAFITATVPGARVSSVFAAGLAAYEASGYGEEWKLHHQGGATGYAGRDYKGTLTSSEVVQPWQAFAWNPSITGTKSEDTILATPDGPEVISGSPEWPLIEAEAAGRLIGRPDILVR